MHIPDGYLNLPTCAATYVVMTPIWAVAARKLKGTFQAKNVPMIALGAAFCFVLMMFNFPLVGGSSGHAVGGAVLAILLGPWAAVSVLTVVLAIQALLFHDGGLTTLGANAFNMAFVLPISSYFIYQLFARANSSLFRKGLAGALAGYLGLTSASFTTAMMLGVQPHGVSGYAPYPLSVTIPVMVGSHLLVFSWIEGLATAFILVWMTKHFQISALVPASKTKNLWIAIGVLILLSPLGLLARGTAFGEWTAMGLEKMLGYVPSGIARFQNGWASPFSGYRISGHSIILGYLTSALIGTLAAACFAWILGKFLSKSETLPPSTQAKIHSEEKIPQWLLTPQPLEFKEEKMKRTGKPLFSLSHLFQGAFASENLEARDGFLQRLDARIKVAGIFALVILSALLPYPTVLSLLLILALICAVSSRIPLFWYLRTVLLSMAFFSLLIALPAATAWITPGKAWFVIPSSHLTVTVEGARGVGLFALRATTAIAWSALLALTTPWTKILKSLQFFKIPQVFIFIVEMSVRYIFLLTRLVEQMKDARNARAIVETGTQRRWLIGRMSFLLMRSFELSENVYSAMLARGYSGNIKTLEK